MWLRLDVLGLTVLAGVLRLKWRRLMMVVLSWRATRRDVAQLDYATGVRAGHGHLKLQGRGWSVRRDIAAWLPPVLRTPCSVSQLHCPRPLLS